MKSVSCIRRMLICVGGVSAAWSAVGQAVVPLQSYGGKDELWNDRGSVVQFHKGVETNNALIEGYTGIELGYAGSGVGDVDGDTLNDFAATYYWHDYDFTGTDRRVLNDADTEYGLPYNFSSLPLTSTITLAAGDVRVFGYDGTGISQIGGRIRHRDPIPSGRFAHIIRGRADVDGDGRDDIIAGSGVTGGISVWAFTHRYTGVEEWVQILRIRAPQTAWDQTTYGTYCEPGKADNMRALDGVIQRFGWTVAECTDINNDGSPDVIVGARGFDALHPHIRGNGGNTVTPIDGYYKSEGALLAYCMPQTSWWSKLRGPYPEVYGAEVPGVTPGEYWEEHVRDKHIHSSTGYDGEALVYVDNIDADRYYSLRITDPSLVHAYLNPICNEQHKAYLPASERQWDFAACVRMAEDLDGDDSPDIVVTGPGHLYDDDDDPETDSIRTGKVYVFLSSSGYRSQSCTPANTFGALEPFVHQAWEYKNISGVGEPNPVLGTTQLDLKPSDADLVIVGPPPGPVDVYGIDSLTEGVSEVMPYNDSVTGPQPVMDDIFIACQPRLDGATYKGFAAFFELEKRVKAMTGDGASYPLMQETWFIPLDESYAGDSSGIYPDRYVYSEEGDFNGMNMAGNVDQNGTCKLLYGVQNQVNKTQVYTYNPYKVKDGLVGNFEVIWELFGEPIDGTATPSCDTPADHDHNVPGYSMLEVYEYELPHGTQGSDEGGVTGTVSKNISRWWWTGDIDGDTMGDLLGAAWSYPSLYESGGNVICDPVTNESSVDYFRAGKIYAFLSPFDITGNGDDDDTDGVNDVVDGCISPGDINEDGYINPTDAGVLAGLFTNYVNSSQTAADYALYRAADVDRDGYIEPGDPMSSTDDLDAWLYIYQHDNPCP
ncbi:MAG: hypothetical protein ACIAQ0_13305 [Phycisphaerales bacterium JB058]